ncbi:hypothetical protein MXB_4285 [Myxobolus squamalis]|nr:hypothetical protein MXB_4285 [Myxobolus squamalis]
MASILKAAVIGCFTHSGESFHLTPIGRSFDKKLAGKLTYMLKLDVVVVFAGLGDSSATYCENEEIDLKLEIIRCGIYSVGEVAALSDYEVRKWISGFDPKTKMGSANIFSFFGRNTFKFENAHNNFPVHYIKNAC